MSEYSFKSTQSKTDAYCDTLSDQDRLAFDRLSRDQRRLLLRGFYARRSVAGTGSDYSLGSTVPPSVASGRDRSLGPVHQIPCRSVAPSVSPTLEAPVIEDPVLERESPVPSEFEEVPLVGPPVVAGGVRFLVVRRAPAQGSVDALREADVVATSSEVCYDPDAARFSVVRLYQGTSPFVEFLFVLVSRPQGIDIRQRLQKAEMYHPPGDYTNTVHTVEWALESCFFAPPQDDRPLYSEYQRIVNFVAGVCHVWALEWQEPQRGLKHWGLTGKENQHSRVGVLLRHAMRAVNTGDPDVYLPAMALVGNLVQIPKDSLKTGRLEDMYQVLEFFRAECARVKMGVPTGYRSSSDFLVECIFLGACFPIKCGLSRLGSSLGLACPFLHWESVGTAAQQYWLTGLTVLYRIVPLFSFGDYVEVSPSEVSPRHSPNFCTIKLSLFAFIYLFYFIFIFIYFFNIHLLVTSDSHFVYFCIFSGIFFSF